jgi:hypothetical protein
MDRNETLRLRTVKNPTDDDILSQRATDEVWPQLRCDAFSGFNHIHGKWRTWNCSDLGGPHAGEHLAVFVALHQHC